MSEQPMRSAQCNSLNYTDNRGVEREIYLPQGTMHEAWEHVQHERWGELERFDDYGGFSAMWFAILVGGLADWGGV